MNIHENARLTPRANERDLALFDEAYMHNTNLAAYVVGERVADLVLGG